MVPLDSLTLKKLDLDTKIVILSALMQKFMVKEVFAQNGGKCNAFGYVSLKHFTTTKVFWQKQ